MGGIHVGGEKIVKRRERLLGRGWQKLKTRRLTSRGRPQLKP